jgi:hypothetical protein
MEETFGMVWGEELYKTSSFAVTVPATQATVENVQWSVGFILFSWGSARK